MVINPNNTGIFYHLIVLCEVQLDPKLRFTTCTYHSEADSLYLLVPDILFFAKCFDDGFLPIKNYDDQNIEIWRCNVQCHELTLLRATRDATSHVRGLLSKNVNKMLLERTFKCLSISNDTQNESQPY